MLCNSAGWERRQGSVAWEEPARTANQKRGGGCMCQGQLQGEGQRDEDQVDAV